MLIRNQFTCPYCGLQQGAYVDTDEHNAADCRIVYCDDCEGGCGRRLVLDHRVHVTFAATGLACYETNDNEETEA